MTFNNTISKQAEEVLVQMTTSRLAICTAITALPDKKPTEEELLGWEDLIASAETISRSFSEELNEKETEFDHALTALKSALADLKDNLSRLENETPAEPNIVGGSYLDSQTPQSSANPFSNLKYS